MEAQAPDGGRFEELEELQTLATPELPWPHELSADALADTLLEAVFDGLAQEAKAEQLREKRLPVWASGRESKQNRREAYLSLDKRRDWEDRARNFIERRPDVVRALSTEALYSALMMQHLLELDAADADLPASERCSEDTFANGINGQFVLDATRGRYTVEGEVFHFEEAEAGESEEAFLARLTEGIRRVVLKRGGIRQLERVTTAMSQCGVAALERAALCRAVVSGGTLRVDYRLDEHPEQQKGLLVRLQTRRQGFREYLLGEFALGAEDAAPLPCDTSSSLQRTATVTYGLRGEVDVLDFREEIEIRRGGEPLEQELLCSAIPWRPPDILPPAAPDGPVRQQLPSFMQCVRLVCSRCRCRPRQQQGVQVWEATAGGGSGATLEL